MAFDFIFFEQSRQNLALPTSALGSILLFIAHLKHIALIFSNGE